MARRRNEERWRTEFAHYKTLEEFLGEPRTDGIHSVAHGGQILDVLVKDRGSRTTLVAFNAAVGPASDYPHFSGIRVAEDVGSNLIAVSDPSVSMGSLTVAWYIGNSVIGSLRDVLGRLIKHVVDSLGGSQTILFGGSGGGYAAAHYAPMFPGCITFIFNPRLTLLRHSEAPVRAYLETCHARIMGGYLSREDEELLARFGPLDMSDAIGSDIEYDLLIYQNLLDRTFLTTQVLPFVDAVGENPRVKYRYEVDDLGHSPIPPARVREIIGWLMRDATPTGIAEAGFMPNGRAIFDAVGKYGLVHRRIAEAARLRKAKEGEFENVSREKRDLERRVADLKKAVEVVRGELAAANEQRASLEVALSRAEVDRQALVARNVVLEERVRSAGPNFAVAENQECAGEVGQDEASFDRVAGGAIWLVLERRARSARRLLSSVLPHSLRRAVWRQLHRRKR